MTHMVSSPAARRRKDTMNSAFIAWAAKMDRRPAGTESELQ
jgi:hypothetical protein